jgi:broad specificity phosphatase PhoE
MAEILLIRHGQASFGQENYDVLSPLGWQQGACLGEYLIACNNPLDNVVCGTLERHRDTAIATLDVIKDKTGAEYTPLFDSRLNEIDTNSFAHFLPELLKQEPELEALVESSHYDSRAYQKIFRAAFKLWLTKGDDTEHMETWPTFKSRVLESFNELKEQTPSGKRSAIFTSGGAIATITAHVLGLPDNQVYSVFEPLINASVTRIAFTTDLTTVSCYNDYGYLAALKDSSYITYR